MATKTYYHLAVYNEATKKVELEKKIDAEASVKTEVKDFPDESVLLWRYDLNRYMAEKAGRGDPWKVYCDTVPFSWDRVMPKEVPEEVTE